MAGERKPDSVLGYHLSDAVYPPARAGNSQTPVYLTLQPPVPPHRQVALPMRELLPHVFTLTCLRRRYPFCCGEHTRGSLPEYLSFDSGAPCVVRTFLPYEIVEAIAPLPAILHSPMLQRINSLFSISYIFIKRSNAWSLSCKFKTGTSAPEV